MHATLSPAKADLVQVARAEEALSRLARQAAGKASYRRSRLLPSDFSAAPLVPAVDPTMRSVGNGQNFGRPKVAYRPPGFHFNDSWLGCRCNMGLAMVRRGRSARQIQVCRRIPGILQRS